MRNLKYCVYSHSVESRVIYVGAGSIDRANDFNTRSIYWRDAVGSRPVEVKILSTHLTRDGAEEREKKFVASLKPCANRRLLGNDKNEETKTIFLPRGTWKLLKAVTKAEHISIKAFLARTFLSYLQLREPIEVNHEVN